MSNNVHSWLMGIAPAVLWVVCISGVAAVVAAAGDDDWHAPKRDAHRKNPVPGDDKSVAAGKAVYLKECQCCHGAAGKGDGPAARDLDPKPSDLSEQYMWYQSDGELFWKITTGRKPMPGFETTLSEQNRWQVVNYVRTLAPKPPEAGESKGASK
jgi:mono/diheme cytochrome c family protein